MKEIFLIKNKRIADSLTEAQSHAVNYGERYQIVKFRYRTDEKTIELYLTPQFLKMRYSIVREYLDNCIRHFLAKSA